MKKTINQQFFVIPDFDLFVTEHLNLCDIISLKLSCVYLLNRFYSSKYKIWKLFQSKFNFKNWNLTACQFYLKAFVWTHENIICVFQIACRNDFELAKWLTEEFQLTREDVIAKDNLAFRLACDYGNLEIAKWLTQQFQLTREDAMVYDNQAFRWTCYSGRLEMAKWLTQEFKITREDVISENNAVFRWTCDSGNFDIAKWLTQEFEITRKDAIIYDYFASRWACRDGHFEMVKWLIATESCNIPAE